MDTQYVFSNFLIITHFFRGSFFQIVSGFFPFRANFRPPQKWCRSFFHLRSFFRFSKNGGGAFFRVIFRSFFRWPFFCRPFYFRAFFMIRPPPPPEQKCVGSILFAKNACLKKTQKNTN